MSRRNKLITRVEESHAATGPTMEESSGQQWREIVAATGYTVAALRHGEMRQEKGERRGDRSVRREYFPQWRKAEESSGTDGSGT